MTLVRPEKQAYLKRWQGDRSTPTVWEKLDNDPVYERVVKKRYDEINTDSLGTSWGRRRGPK